MLIFRYLIYFAKSRNEYLIHSPFAYDFVTNITYVVKVILIKIEKS